MCHPRVGGDLVKGVMKQYYVYVLASKKNGVLYIGVTNNLVKRINEHKAGLKANFTDRYYIKRLVYFEILENITDAIIREKRLKKWNRSWKIRLIEQDNPEWRDISNQLY